MSYEDYKNDAVKNEEAFTVSSSAFSLQQSLFTHARQTAIEEMGAAIAHEMNQPLTAIALYLDALERESNIQPSPLDPKLLSLLKKARNETARASDIITGMKRFGQSSNRHLAEHDFGKVVREAVDLAISAYKSDADHQAFSITQNIPSDLYIVEIDLIQIQQVIANLVHNAVEAIHDSAKREIEITVREKDNTIILTISDSGQGVPDSLRDQMFNNFISTKEDGMGLGLAICQTIAQSHGGKIIETGPSNLGGACFSLVLPR